ncbi:HEAT repeat domain-containing protein [Singulisphaera sp. PoT]|uniref:HEAT repeat domain-containing protein n=1 Tax=Singulisphaera sp. PoT TaxID=3411797 RepID=UPI003BF4B12E
MSEPTTSGPESEPPRPARPRRLQLSMKDLIVLVVCCGALVWAWRYFRDHRPENVEFVSLKSGDVQERQVAARALIYKPQAENERVINALIEALADEAPEVRTEAAVSLGIYVPQAIKAGKASGQAASRALADALSDKSPATREAAVRSLAAIAAAGPPSSAPSAIYGVLAKDDSPEVRSSAAWALASFKESPDATAKALLEAMRRDQARVRTEATKSLNALTPTPELLQPLTDALGDKEREVQSSAAMNLGKLGAKGIPAVPALIAVLDQPPPPPKPRTMSFTPDWDPACYAAIALARITPKTPAAVEAIEALAKMLDSESPARRDSAAAVLAEFGPAAATVIPTLLTLGRKAQEPVPDAEKTRVGNAIWLLGQIAPGTPAEAEVIATLTQALPKQVAADDIALSHRLIYALGRFGPAAKDALPALRAIGEKSPRVLTARAAESIYMIEHDGKASPKPPNDLHLVSGPDPVPMSNAARAGRR